MTFNRSRNDRPGRGGDFRPRFNDRGSSRGPVELHKAICDNCGKECEVPFRPTSGKPIFCNNCFENQRGGSDSRRFEGRNYERSEDRPMFNATCADCGNACKVPFQPNGDKPVFCSNCFGDKKNAGGTGGKDERSSPVLEDKFEEINDKLDRILGLLSPVVPVAKKKASVKKSPEEIS